MGMENISEKLPDGTDLVGINLTGMVTGSAHVSTGTAIIRGMVCGDLIVEEGASVEIHGTVTGNLFVRGTAVVSGTVSGPAYVEGLGQLTIQDGAICAIAVGD